MSQCNQRISFADVTKIRQRFAEGQTTVRELAELYKINYRYCYDILQGTTRQSADARRPIPNAPLRGSLEYLQDPKGNLFIRRGRRRGFKKQISFETIWQIRHMHQMNGTPPSDLAVRFGVSLSTIHRVLKNKTRVSS